MYRSVVLSLGLVTLLAGPALAQSSAPQAAEQAYQEMEESLGMVPSFLKLFPAAGIAGAWDEMKSIQLNPDTAVPGKYKELIGLAVAAQIPCDYCVFFHTEAAKLNGATDEEIGEALAMAALTRHWSTFLNGAQLDKAEFRKETEEIMRFVTERSNAENAKSGSDE